MRRHLRILWHSCELAKNWCWEFSNIWLSDKTRSVIFTAVQFLCFWLCGQRSFTLQSQLISNNKRQRICTAVLMTMSRQLTTADKIKSCLGQSPVSRHKMLFSTPAVMTHDMSTTVQFLCFCLLFSEILHCKVSWFPIAKVKRLKDLHSRAHVSHDTWYTHYFSRFKIAYCTGLG